MGYREQWGRSWNERPFSQREPLHHASYWAQDWVSRRLLHSPAALFPLVGFAAPDVQFYCIHQWVIPCAELSVLKESHILPQQNEDLHVPFVPSGEFADPEKKEEPDNDG